MNDSQKILLARVMLLINDGFKGMPLQQQAEFAQAINQRLERQIMGIHNLQAFNAQIRQEQAAADQSEAQYKQRKAAYEKEIADKAAASQPTPDPVQSTAEQEAVSTTEVSADSEPNTEAQ